MSTTPATPGPYAGTSLPATTPAAWPPGLAEGFTDAQLQAAIDAAFPIEARFTGDWPDEAPNRLAIARAFLAALPARPAAQPAAWPGQQEAIDAAFVAADAVASFTPFKNAFPLKWQDQAPARLAIAQAYDRARPQAAEIAKLKGQMEKAQGILKACLSVMPFGNIETHTVENLPGRIADLASDIAAVSSENERLEAELASLRQPILADDGRSLWQVAEQGYNEALEGHVNDSHEYCMEAAAQAVAAVVEARMIRRMEAVPVEELWYAYEAANTGYGGMGAARARLISAAKGEGQAKPVVVNEPPQDEQQPDLSGESEKQPEEPAQAQQEPAQPWTPKPGDVVRLKSGGPEMTVTGIFNCPKAGYHAALAWFDNGRFGTLNATFPALQPAKEEAQP